MFTALLSIVKRSASCTLLVSTTLIGTSVFANPVLNNISTGNAQVTQTQTSTTIQQTSQQAIINWNSFNIGKGETTRFIQPNQSASALNRIDPMQGASQIYGALNANGQVILINAAGIHFGPSAMVNVGSIIASTSDISDSNFLSGNYVFDKPSQYAGNIKNEGNIIAAQHGLVALLGSNIQNNGMIKADRGSIVLGTGSKFTLDFYGDQLINFSVNAKATSGGKIKNYGSLIANGGKVLITARAAQSVVDNTIYMGGVVQANSVHQVAGEIILDGGSGKVRVSGKISARGKSDNAGGSIEILGKDITLASSAKVDVSGDTGGGNIYIGGNAHGAGPLPNAQTVFVASGAQLKADAYSKGNGGNVVVWSDDATQFHGNISAHGGALEGNGGFAETSGHYLDIAGTTINLSAAHGSTGTWLLDPTNVTINTTASNPPFTNPYTADNNTTATNINVTDITNALSGGANVIITTTSGGTGAGSGNITVATPITWSTAQSLRLNSINNIAINSAITMNSAGASLILNFAGSGTQTGAINGAGSLVKEGVGTLSLSLANGYTGSTTINGGKISIDNINRINTASGITINSIDSPATFAYTGTSASFTNPITIGTGGGTIQVNTTVARTLTLTGGITDNGALTFDSAGAGAGAITVSTNGISGGGSVTKTNTGAAQGTLTFGVANTYTGATLVNTNAGILTVSNVNGLGSAGNQSSSITVLSGGELNLTFATATLGNTNLITLNGSGVAGVGALTAGGNNITVSNAITLGSNTTVGGGNSTFTLSGIIDDAGAGYSLTKVGANTIALTNANTYSGGTTINTGTLSVTNPNGLSTSGAIAINNAAILSLNLGANGGTLANASTITMSGTSSLTDAVATTKTDIVNNPITLTGTTATITSTTSGAIFNLTGGINNGTTNLTFTGSGNTIQTGAGVIGNGAGSVTKTGTGTLTLNNANTYTGGTSVSAGTLAITNPNALSTIGTIALSGTGILNINLGGNTLANTSTLSMSNTSAITSSVGAGLTDTLNNPITVTGTTNTITSTTATALLSLGGGISHGGTTLTFAGAGNSSESAAITGGGTLSKTGTGTLTLSGSSPSFSGAISITGGTLVAANTNALGDTTGATTVSGTNSTLQVNNVTLAAEPISLSNATFLVGTGNANVPGVITLAGSTATRTISATSLTDTLTLGSSLNNAVALTFGGAGSIILNGAIGNITPLISITANAALTFGNGNVTTTSTQSYLNAVTLNANTSLTSTNATISFSNANATINNFDATARNLSISTGTGAISLFGNVGANGPLGTVLLNSTGTTTIGSTSPATGSFSAANLTTNLGGTTLLNALTMTTNGDMHFGDNVTLAVVGKTLTSSAGAITFDGTIAGAFGLTLSGSTGVNFNGAVATPTFLDVTGAVIGINANITTTGIQTYHNPVVLGANATLTTTNSLVKFISTVDRDVTAARNLSVSAGTGGVLFSDNVGAGVNGALGAITISVTGVGVDTVNGSVNAASFSQTSTGTNAINGGSITTSGLQSFSGSVTLNADTTLTSTANGAITFSGILNSLNSTARALTINTGGTTTFANTVGGTNPLASINTDAAGTTAINAASVTTNGTDGQVYNDPVTLNATTVTLNANSGPITFGNTLNSLATARNLILNSSGVTTFSNVVGATALASLITDAPGSTIFGSNATSITTSNGQAYNDPVTLFTNVNLTTTNNSVIFASTVDRDAGAPRSLLISTGSGAITFTGNVGADVNGEMGALTLNSSGVTNFTGTVAAVSLTTNAGGSTTLATSNITTDDDINFGDAVTLTTIGKTLESNTGAITFNNTLTGAFDLTLSAAVGGVTFKNTVGTTPLASLDVTGDTTVTANVTTSGTQTYHDNVTLSGNVTFTSANSLITFECCIDRDAVAAWNLVVSSGSGGITILNDIGSGLNGALGAVTLTSSGTTTLDGLINSASFVSNGTGGTTLLNGGSVTTSGTQTYSHAVILGADTTLTTTDSLVNFSASASTINSDGTPQDLTISAGAGAIQLNGIVGANSALGAITLNSSNTTTLAANINAASLTTDAGGTTSINSVITTSGNQTYNDAISLAGNTTLIANNLTFTSITGNNRDLALTITGNTLLDGANVIGLRRLSTDGSGITQLQGNLTTSNTQTFNNAVTIVGDTTLDATDNTITFGSTINNDITNSNSLTLTLGAGTLTLNDVVGGTNPLNNFTVSNTGTLNSIAVNFDINTVNNILITTPSPFTLNANLNSTLGDITISTRRFVNNAGANAINPGAGNFLIWSSNPNPFGGANPDVMGGLNYNFKQYNATYGVTPVQGSGNGFLYTLAPVISASLVNVTKVYDGNTTANLDSSNYSLSGVVGGDTVTLNYPNGTYDNPNAGTGKTVDANGVAITSATNGSATVYGYQLASTTASTNNASITPAPLTVTADDQTKTYGETFVFNGTEFTNSPLVNGETIGSVTLTSAGAPSDATVEGSPYSIVASNATGGTFNPANYAITYVDGVMTVNGVTPPDPPTPPTPPVPPTPVIIDFNVIPGIITGVSSQLEIQNNIDNNITGLIQFANGRFAINLSNVAIARYASWENGELILSGSYPYSSVNYIAEYSSPNFFNSLLGGFTITFPELFLMQYSSLEYDIYDYVDSSYDLFMPKFSFPNALTAFNQKMNLTIPNLNFAGWNTAQWEENIFIYNFAKILQKFPRINIKSVSSEINYL